MCQITTDAPEKRRYTNLFPMLKIWIGVNYTCGVIRSFNWGYLLFLSHGHLFCVCFLNRLTQKELIFSGRFLFPRQGINPYILLSDPRKLCDGKSWEIVGLRDQRISSEGQEDSHICWCVFSYTVWVAFGLSTIFRSQRYPAPWDTLHWLKDV